MKILVEREKFGKKKRGWGERKGKKGGGGSEKKRKGKGCFFGGVMDR